MSNFLKYCNRISCVEDLAVISYSEIYSEFDSCIANEYNPKDKDGIINAIDSYFKKSKINEIDAIMSLKNDMKRLFEEKKFDAFDYFCIIKSIDINYEYQTNPPTLEISNFHKYDSLSIISDDPDVFILPKFNNSYIDIFNEALKKYELKEQELKKHSHKKDICKKGLRAKLPYDLNHINAYLNNIILLHKKDIGNNKIMVHEYIVNKLNYEDFVVKIQNNKSFKCAIVPMINKGTNEIFNIETDEKNFWINGIKNSIENKIITEYISTIEMYKNIDVDFIVFPELFMSETIINEIHKHLIKNDNHDRIQIYILGSIWSDNSNKAVVMTSDGEYICEQYKIAPSTIKGLREKLIYNDKTINLFDFPNCIRMNLLICRDIIDGKIMSIPQYLESNLILSPCYSPSLDMKKEIKSLSSKYYCLTIMANSCSARFNGVMTDNNKQIGFICKPIKKGTEITNQINNYYRTFDKCKNCDFDCPGFVVTINFGKIDDKEKTYETLFNFNVDSLSSL